MLRERYRVSLLLPLLAGVLLLSAAGCTGKATTKPAAEAPPIDLQGHRGARGLLPENTIPSFLKAIDVGATTLEIDVVLSKDGEVVVSHEPWFSSTICSTPDGEPIPEDDARSYNLYTMTYEEIAAFDCGLRGHTGFPEQHPMPASKPLLDSVITAVERHVAERDLSPVRYNIEVKSSEEMEGVYYPPVADFVQRVYDVMAAHDVLDHTMMQSFDPRAIEAVHAIDSTLTVAFLVSNDLGLTGNLARLDFTPDGYNPAYGLVDSALVAAVHARGMTLTPWTVNDAATMRALLDLGVDGLITDYPDLGRAVLDSLEMEK